MHMPNINKKKPLKHVVEMNDSQYRDTIDKKYSSYLTTRQEHLDLFDTFFTNCYQTYGTQDTVDTLRMGLSVIPDETNEWWLTIPDSIWLAVLRFKVSIAVYTKAEQKALFFERHVDTRITSALGTTVYGSTKGVLEARVMTKAK
ncbi:hypothetical protein BD560DRAFT_488823 [Blakeslea trispora]|nr:hypothetical protein BD560DRAFT_488823 [Blakeslea trispora]